MSNVSKKKVIALVTSIIVSAIGFTLLLLGYFNSEIEPHYRIVYMLSTLEEISTELMIAGGVIVAIGITGTLISTCLWQRWYKMSNVSKSIIGVLITSIIVIAAGVVLFIAGFFNDEAEVVGHERYYVNGILAETIPIYGEIGTEMKIGGGVLVEIGTLGIVGSTYLIRKQR